MFRHLRAVAEADFEARRASKLTYTAPLDVKGPNAKEISDFLFAHRRKFKPSDAQRILSESSVVWELHAYLVPDMVSEEDFWQRYGFRCNKVRIMKQLEMEDPEVVRERANSLGMNRSSHQKIRLASSSQAFAAVVAADSKPTMPNESSFTKIHLKAADKSVSASKLTSQIQEPSYRSIKLRATSEHISFSSKSFDTKQPSYRNIKLKASSEHKSNSSSTTVDKNEPSYKNIKLNMASEHKPRSLSTTEATEQLYTSIKLKKAAQLKPEYKTPKINQPQYDRSALKPAPTKTLKLEESKNSSDSKSPSLAATTPAFVKANASISQPPSMKKEQTTLTVNRLKEPANVQSVTAELPLQDKMKTLAAMKTKISNGHVYVPPKDTTVGAIADIYVASQEIASQEITNRIAQVPSSAKKRESREVKSAISQISMADGCATAPNTTQEMEPKETITNHDTQDFSEDLQLEKDRQSERTKKMDIACGAEDKGAAQAQEQNEQRDGNTVTETDVVNPRAQRIDRQNCVPISLSDGASKDSSHLVRIKSPNAASERSNIGTNASDSTERDVKEDHYCLGKDLEEKQKMLDKAWRVLEEEKQKLMAEESHVKARRVALEEEKKKLEEEGRAALEMLKALESRKNEIAAEKKRLEEDEARSFFNGLMVNREDKIPRGVHRLKLELALADKGFATVKTETPANHALDTTGRIAYSSIDSSVEPAGSLANEAEPVAGTTAIANEETTTATSSGMEIGDMGKQEDGPQAAMTLGVLDPGSVTDTVYLQPKAEAIGDQNEGNETKIGDKEVTEQTTTSDAENSSELDEKMDRVDHFDEKVDVVAHREVVHQEAKRKPFTVGDSPATTTGGDETDNADTEPLMNDTNKDTSLNIDDMNEPPAEGVALEESGGYKKKKSKSKTKKDLKTESSSHKRKKKKGKIPQKKVSIDKKATDPSITDAPSVNDTTSTLAKPKETGPVVGTTSPCNSPMEKASGVHTDSKPNDAEIPGLKSFAAAEGLNNDKTQLKVSSEHESCKSEANVTAEGLDTSVASLADTVNPENEVQPSAEPPIPTVESQVLPVQEESSTDTNTENDVVSDESTASEVPLKNGLNGKAEVFSQASVREQSKVEPEVEAVVEESNCPSEAQPRRSSPGFEISGDYNTETHAEAAASPVEVSIQVSSTIGNDNGPKEASKGGFTNGAEIISSGALIPSNTATQTVSEAAAEAGLLLSHERAWKKAEKGLPETEANEGISRTVEQAVCAEDSASKNSDTKSDSDLAKAVEIATIEVAPSCENSDRVTEADSAEAIEDMSLTAAKEQVGGEISAYKSSNEKAKGDSAKVANNFRIDLPVFEDSGEATQNDLAEPKRHTQAGLDNSIEASPSAAAELVREHAIEGLTEQVEASSIEESACENSDKKADIEVLVINDISSDAETTENVGEVTDKAQTEEKTTESVTETSAKEMEEAKNENKEVTNKVVTDSNAEDDAPSEPIETSSFFSLGGRPLFSWKSSQKQEQASQEVAKKTLTEVAGQKSTEDLERQLYEVADLPSVNNEIEATNYQDMSLTTDVKLASLPDESKAAINLPLAASSQDFFSIPAKKIAGLFGISNHEKTAMSPEEEKANQWGEKMAEAEQNTKSACDSQYSQIHKYKEDLVNQDLSSTLQSLESMPSLAQGKPFTIGAFPTSDPDVVSESDKVSESFLSKDSYNALELLPYAAQSKSLPIDEHDIEPEMLANQDLEDTVLSSETWVQKAADKVGETGSSCSESAKDKTIFANEGITPSFENNKSFNTPEAQQGQIKIDSTDIQVEYLPIDGANPAGKSSSGNAMSSANALKLSLKQAIFAEELDAADGTVAKETMVTARTKNSSERPPPRRQRSKVERDAKRAEILAKMKHLKALTANK